MGKGGQDEKIFFRIIEKKLVFVKCSNEGKLRSGFFRFFYFFLKKKMLEFICVWDRVTKPYLAAGGGVAAPSQESSAHRA